MREANCDDATEELKLLACMSAVKLSTEQSDEAVIDMIKELLDGPMPFICAHGRPSILPLF
jgi:DNA mismatch repair ATPase MutL